MNQIFIQNHQLTAISHCGLQIYLKMSTKISEYFKLTPKVKNSVNCDKKVEKSSNVQECRVIIKDIKDQFGENLNLFDEISLNELADEIGNKTCRFCQKEFSFRSGLRKHMINFHSDKFEMFKCLVCSQKFFQQNFLNLHMTKKHPNGQIKLFECDFDGKLFNNKVSLYHHIMMKLTCCS